MNQQSELSIIIVCYYGADLLEQCLHSLQQNLPELKCEMIVVSNGFEDSEKAALLQLFPSLIWIDMPGNAGFSRANNAGMRVASGEVFLLLNPDTVALDHSIDECFHRLQESKFVAAGVQLLNINHEPQISGSHFVKGGLNHLLPIPYWGSFIRWIGYRSKTKVPGVQQAKEVEEVDWISGAFLMVKREAAESAGLLDEDFFLYAE
ncbi:MAG: glycosyltransferase, partial [Flavobacterium sp.]